MRETALDYVDPCQKDQRKAPRVRVGMCKGKWLTTAMREQCRRTAVIEEYDLKEDYTVAAQKGYEGPRLSPLAWENERMFRYDNFRVDKNIHTTIHTTI